MSDRSQDWFNQARHNLDQAATSRAAGYHDWACFAAQQAAEMAVKALHLAIGEEVWGHVVRKLLTELPPDLAAASELLDRARVLDGYYVAARYANGHTEGAPFEHYGDLQSREAIEHAAAIVDFCSNALAERRRG
jgi:HEPN domain-containing protein